MEALWKAGIIIIEFIVVQFLKKRTMKVGTNASLISS